MILTVIIFQGIIFIGLIFIMRQFMKGHLSGAMGHLQKLNDDLLKQQAEFREKSAAAQKEYEMKMAKLQQDIASEQQRAKEESSKTIEETKKKALGEREKIINEAVETREKMRKEIMSEMEETSIQHSKTVISEFFKGDLRTLIHETLMNQAFEGLQGAEMGNFTIETGTAALLRVPVALKPEMQEKIRKILQEKIKKPVDFKEEIDPEIVAGVVIKFGNVIIDGSLTNRLSEAAAALKKENARRYQKII